VVAANTYNDGAQGVDFQDYDSPAALVDAAKGGGHAPMKVGRRRLNPC